MKCKEILSRLDEVVNGELAAAELERVRAHLEACAGCREEVEAMRGILERAAALPRTVEPTHDLWPGIAERLDRGGVSRGVFGGRPRWLYRPALLAAAASVIIVAAVVTGYMIGRRGGSGVIADGRPRAPEAPLVRVADLGGASLAAAEADFRRARGELLAALEERRGFLSPETMAVVLDNLRLIDLAIESIANALAENPGDAQLTYQLAAAYRQEINLLQRATQLPVESSPQA